MQVDEAQFRQQVAGLIHTGLPSPEDRFNQFSAIDPYPAIPPALLNAGHIASYAITTGMIDPFDVKNLTKPATYLAEIEGSVRYRDERGRTVRFYLTDDHSAKPRTGEIQEDEIRAEFDLQPNSLCYVQLRPTFRLPAYIACRFNLLIRDVYRGLLVGTGPLVDPGFTGKLYIPIHNLTTNTYKMAAGEGLVYFEFTKLGGWQSPSTRPTWVRPEVNDQPPFPVQKAGRRTVDHYLVSATGGGPATNAVGQEMQELQKTAAIVKKISKATEGRLRIYSVAGVAGIAVLVIACWQLMAQVQSNSDATRSEVVEKASINDLQSVRAELGRLHEKIAAIDVALAAQHEADVADDKLEKLRQMLRDVAARIDAIESARRGTSQKATSPKNP